MDYLVAYGHTEAAIVYAGEVGMEAPTPALCAEMNLRRSAVAAVEEGDLSSAIAQIVEHIPEVREHARQG